jgi:colanic acid/amylovoran biosynthesis protein
MRVLVLWASDVSPNLGVRALAQGSHDLLTKVWPGAEFTYADYGKRPQQVPWGRMRSMAKERVTGRLGMQRWLGGFDLIWDTRSGDSFADIYGLGRLGVMSSLHEYARQAGTRVVMAPQTIGPFTTRRGRFLARRTLRRSALVLARDPQSAEAAARLGRNVDATVSDLVFGIDQPGPADPHDVIMNVSGLLWRPNPHVDSVAYQAAVRTIIAALIADGRRITLLPHVLDSGDPDNDVPTARALTEEFGGAIDHYIPNGLDDARSVIASASLLIGARMHACLNALSTGVPAIAMAYSRKFEPLMRSIEWSHVVSLIGTVDVASEVLKQVADPTLGAQAKSTQQQGRDLLALSLPLLREIG